MKRFEYAIALFLIAVTLFSCTADVTEKVLLNGLELPSSLEKPEDDESYAEVMADAEKCRVLAVDKSTPAGDVDSRVWVLRDSYDDIVRTITDSAAVRLSLPTAGIYSLTLTINDDVEGSIKNWIKVEGEVQSILSDAKVDFINPSRSFEVSDTRNFPVLLKAEIWEDELDLITIVHNGKTIKSSNYEFDESSAQITFMAKLKEGENTVQVLADLGKDVIDVSRKIEYIKSSGGSGSSQLSQSSSGSSNSGGSSSSISSNNRSADVDERERPEESLAAQVEKENETPAGVDEVAQNVEEEIEEVQEVAKEETSTPTTPIETNVPDNEDDEGPINTFDHKNQEKSLSSYNQAKVLGIKVSNFSELNGDCALKYAGGSFVVNISDLKDIMYIESLKLAQNPDTEGTDVTFELECLNSDKIGRARGSEDGVIGYSEGKAEKITLSRLSRLAMLPGNSYRLTVTCEADTQLGYVNVSNCGGKIDKNDIVKLDYKDGKCPFFSLKLKH